MRDVYIYIIGAILGILLGFIGGLFTGAKLARLPEAKAEIELHHVYLVEKWEKPAAPKADPVKDSELLDQLERAQQ